MTEVALRSSSQDCRLETAEARLGAGPGLSLQMGPVSPRCPSLCAREDPGD